MWGGWCAWRLHDGVEDFLTGWGGLGGTDSPRGGGVEGNPRRPVKQQSHASSPNVAIAAPCMLWLPLLSLLADVWDSAPPLWREEWRVCLCMRVCIPSLDNGCLSRPEDEDDEDILEAYGGSGSGIKVSGVKPLV
ncbi:hypothetical protein E2C01_060785 [Portunus trituberculatus]|uniref:Uncharacterized protein n=1 Tax=Portunus trituberculatus TaxID=210409 RepID=A0A5B7HAF3_PORTR|nr:hypothetical protein [Portunus trituberculatus]